MSVDRSGEAVDLRGDPSSTFEMGASQNQCICHVLEPLKSSFAVEGLGDACTCADNEAGVVQDRVERFDRRGTEPFEPFAHSNSFKIGIFRNFSLENSKNSENYNIF